MDVRWGGRGRSERTVCRGKEGGDFSLHTLSTVVEVGLVALVVIGGGACAGGGGHECGKEKRGVGRKQGRVWEERV